MPSSHPSSPPAAQRSSLHFGCLLTVAVLLVLFSVHSLLPSTTASVEGFPPLLGEDAIHNGAIPSNWEQLSLPTHCVSGGSITAADTTLQLTPDGSYACIPPPTEPAPASLAQHSLLISNLTTESQLTQAHAANNEPVTTTPAPDPTVSVVLMNWQRPNNTQIILDAYILIPSVVEIVVLMLRPETAFEYQHPKVRILHNYTLNTDHGLSLRFLGCLFTKGTYVLIQDDDVMTDAKGISLLLASKLGHPDRLAGCCGRDWTGPRPAYVPLHVDPGPARIVLTIAMLTHREACADFWRHRLLMEDLVSLGTPKWNGEDIFFSLVSFKSSGELPEVVAFNYTQLSEAGGGIHYGKGHRRYRGLLLKLAIKRLGIADMYKGYVARPVTGVAKLYAPKLASRRNRTSGMPKKEPADPRFDAFESEMLGLLGGNATT